jgi:hypothetical protein
VKIRDHGNNARRGRKVQRALKTPKKMKHTIADVTATETEFRMNHNRIGLFNSHFQNFKQFGIPKAQLILTDIPYNIGKDAYGSNPTWYVGGDNRNGESDLAGEEFFDTDKDFRPAEFMHFCSQMLRPEPKESGKAPCMVVFCEFEQQFIARIAQLQPRSPHRKPKERPNVG